MADEKTIEAYNKIAEDYRLRNSVTMYDKEYEIYQSLVGDKKKIIEMGCGIGRDAIKLIEFGFEYIGIDASEEMLKIAHEKVPGGKFILGDFYKLDFPDGIFDGFWAAASFLHVPKSDINNVLSEAKRILKKGGIGFISIKDKINIDEGFIKEDKAGGIERYFSFYSKDEFEKILSDNGFEIVQSMFRQENNKDKTNWLCFFVRNL